MLLVWLLKFTQANQLFLGASTSKPLATSNDPVCKAIAVLDRFMKCKGFGLHKGQIHKKINGSKFTFVYCCSVHDFISRSLRNAEVANVLASRVDQVAKILSNPSCGIIEPFKIDYNLIEVLPAGTVFHIAGKRFVKHKSLNVSPRAFVKYTYLEDRVPYPKPFVHGTFFFIIQIRNQRWHYLDSNAKC